MADEKIRKHVHIYGMVQGVFFRMHIRSQAKMNSVSGWVKNIPEGVEAVFEGDKEAVDKMLEACKTGPPKATVSDIKVKDEKFKGESAVFEIKY